MICVYFPSNIRGFADFFRRTMFCFGVGLVGLRVSEGVAVHRDGVPRAREEGLPQAAVENSEKQSWGCLPQRRARLPWLDEFSSANGVKCPAR